MSDYIHILGVPNFGNYEATAAIIRVPRRGGEIEYVTVAEERLSRVKHTYDFPLRGVDYCLKAFGLESLQQIDFIYTDYARIPRWLNSGPGYRKLEHDYIKLRLDYPRDRIRIVDHHDAHAASAFYPSPFDEAAVLIVDALGSRLNTQTLYHFRDGSVEEIERGNHWGIGRLYSLVTGSVLPYGPEKGFGKTMGLAPYGRMHPGPVLQFNGRDEGLTTDYSAFCTRAPLARIVAPDVRRCQDREAVLDPYFARAAYDVQQECERQMVRMAQYAYERTGARNICVAGGVALNGLSNARILRDTPFEQIWIPPGCSDTGLSLGLALWGYFRDIATESGARVTVSMPTAYTGRPYPRASLTALLDQHGIDYTPVEPEAIASLIATGHVIGWFEGGSEFGPRALGHRSINADPRDPAMKDILNHRVKFREGYRPYAPSILAEHAHDWLDLQGDSPFMLLVVEVREDKRALVPAITHVDNTTRPQTVTREASPNYYRMIAEFHRLTGVPMVMNTSLNINREPIVETPIDLLICGFATAIDYLYADGLLIEARRYASPERVKSLTAQRQHTLDEEWRTITARYLTRHDAGERDAYLAEENRIAEWHRSYRAKYELEGKIRQWVAAGSSVLVVGTRAHTSCLYSYIAEFPDLRVTAFVPLDHRPGERGEFDVYPEVTLDAADWTAVDAVLISTHEYQDDTARDVRAAAGAGVEVFTIYDDAGDSLLHVLPGTWPLLATTGRTGPAVHVSHAAIDFESHPTPTDMSERYAVIVNYHYCHPPDGFLKGTNAVTPDELDSHLRVLRQNFTCTTFGELLNPHAQLPETVAVVTFDDGLKDVVQHALPVLERWNVPATLFCSSAPLVEGRVLNVHRAQLLQARLGAERFRAGFEQALAAHGRIALDSIERLGLRDMYVYDDEATRRFKTLLNFQVPYAVLDVLLKQMSERHVGPDADVLPQLYMSISDLRRCQDAGLEIGAHGHQHRVQSRLSDEEQQVEMETVAEVLKDTLGVSRAPWSHPWGFAGSWNATTTRLLKEAGFSSGATMVRAIVKPADLRARWELPRFDVRDVFDRQGNLQADKLRALFSAD